MPETSPEVVAVLVENHRRFLGFLEKRVGSREVAEDLLQETFVRGLPRAGQLRDEESVIAWFYRALRNALVDYYRKRAAESRALEGVARENSELIDDPELMDAVCKCAGSLLSTLQKPYAEALKEVDLGGRSVADYAKAAGITANNASVRLHRAREALRKSVVKCCGTCADHGCLDCSCAR